MCIIIHTLMFSITLWISIYYILHILHIASFDFSLIKFNGHINQTSRLWNISKMFTNHSFTVFAVYILCLQYNHLCFASSPVSRALPFRIHIINNNTNNEYAITLYTIHLSFILIHRCSYIYTYMLDIGILYILALML